MCIGMAMVCNGQRPTKARLQTEALQDDTAHFWATLPISLPTHATLFGFATKGVASMEPRRSFCQEFSLGATAKAPQAMWSHQCAMTTETDTTPRWIQWSLRRYLPSSEIFRQFRCFWLKLRVNSSMMSVLAVTGTGDRHARDMLWSLQSLTMQECQPLTSCPSL